MRKFVIIAACLLYCLSPIDLIPDPAIGIGQLDDLGAILLSIRALMRGDSKQLPSP
ncbi:MAG: DUF1232 domain-containing protein [Phycisphaerales bacterium]|nr:DUF1232 domain-containing protein [Phycisphaerales bacterium]